MHQPQHFVTVDILLIHRTTQSALLIQRKKPPFQNLWALPGGHVEVSQQETLEQAARRELREETGLESSSWLLHQVGVFGDPGRDPRGAYVSIFFVALADGSEQPAVCAGDDAGSAAWFPLAALPDLAFDHAKMVRAASPFLVAAQITEEQYRAEVLRTYAGSPDFSRKMTLAALGLAGETGEVVDMVKKHVYQGHEIDLAHMQDELGDVLWYVMLACQACDFTLMDIIAANVAKLRRRYPDGFDVARSREREMERG